MTWYQPALEPGLADMTLLCTVTDVARSEMQGHSYWKVKLRIEEPLYIAPQFQERLKGVRYLESKDRFSRKAGDRIVLFAGVEYEGDDFNIPSWSGTASSLGIVLTPGEPESSGQGDRLLKALKKLAAGEKINPDLVEAFQHYSPAGTAEFLMEQWRMKLLLGRNEIEVEEPGDSLAMWMIPVSFLCGMAATGLIFVVRGRFTRRRVKSLSRTI